MPDLPEPPSSDDEHDAVATNSMMKTPRPPGGWATPKSRMLNDADASSSNSIGQTPAPPGAWRGAPGLSGAKKGILKVRFDESASLSDYANGIHQNSVPALTLAESGAFDNVQEQSLEEEFERAAKRGVTLVDSFGRQRQFDQDGSEIDLPPVTLTQELSPSKRAPSVRVVDSLGNELEAANRRDGIESFSDISELDNTAVFEKMGLKISDIKQRLDEAEAR